MIESKLFLNDSYSTEFKASVLKNISLDNKEGYILDKTLFYPEGGGQPSDKGFCDGLDVYDVQVVQDEIVHFIDGKLELGKEYNFRVDWEYRFDLMQQHTGQHILSGAFEKLFDANTVGFHLTQSNLTIDLDQKLEYDQVKECFILANQIVFENRLVKIHYPDQEALESMPLRKQPKYSQNIRITEVEGFDFSPCGGTHVRRTGEIGLISLRKFENHRGGIRVEFNCGSRSLQDTFTRGEILSSLVSKTSCKESDLDMCMQRTYMQVESLKKELSEKNSALLDSLATKLSKESENSYILFISEAHDTKQLKDLSIKLLSVSDKVSVLGNPSDGKFLITAPPSLGVNVKEIVQSISGYEYKGGGNPSSFQGSLISGSLESFLSEVAQSLSK